MNAGVNSEKEKVKESQSVTVNKSVTPSLDTQSGAGLGASQSTTMEAGPGDTGDSKDVVCKGGDVGDNGGMTCKSRLMCKSMGV